MTRLPTVGGDEGNWGNLLNDYLSQSHAPDGALKTQVVGAPQLKQNAVTSAAIAPGAVTAAAIPDAGLPSAKLSDKGQAGGVATLDDNGNILTSSGQEALTSATVDTEIAAKINDVGSATTTVLSATIAAGVAPKVDKSERSPVTPGIVTRKGTQSATAEVVWSGHSLVYGQDTVTGGGASPINGSAMARSTAPSPEKMDAIASLMAGGNYVNVTNQGYPGDTTANELTRWAAGVTGDMEIHWIDTNEASGALTVQQSVANMEDLIRRTHAAGSQAVIIGGAPRSSALTSKQVRAYFAAHAAVARRMGAMVFDVGQMLLDHPSSDFTVDGTHFKSTAYSMIGAKMAHLAGAWGSEPPLVGPGTVIRPKHFIHGGGTNTARATAVDGETVRLVTTGSVGFGFRSHVPVTPVIRFYTDTAGSGVGTGQIIYNGGTSGKTTRRINIPSTPSGYVLVRAHDYQPGVDNIIIQNLTGSLEIESITFVPTYNPIARKSATQTTRRSYLAGSMINGTTAGWDFQLDDASPVATINSAGANSYARFDFHVTLDQPASGDYVGVCIAAGGGDATSGIRSGYSLLRSPAGSLVLRTHTDGAVTDSGIASQFAAGRQQVTLTFEFDTSGNMRTLLDGVEKHAPATHVWRHYIPGAIGKARANILAATVTGDVNAS